MSKNAIEVRNLTKKYNGFILDNVCFDIPEGSIVGFIGENGAGKSTTMKAILGLMPIEEGDIKVLGNPVHQGASGEKWREQISVVFDECNFPNELKLKNINIFMKDIYQTWDEDLFMGYLKKFELPMNKKIRCHPANYLEPFSSVYFDALFGSNSVTVRLKGSASAK